MLAAKSVSKGDLARIAAAALILCVGVFALYFSGVIGDRKRPSADEGFEPAGVAFELASFRDLAGWRADDQSAAAPALLRSCARLASRPDDAPANPSERLGEGAPPGASLAGRVGDWRMACDAAADLVARPYDDVRARALAARVYFETHFQPVRLLERRRAVASGPAAGRPDFLAPEGRFTGYFEPTYGASPVRTEEFSAAVYARPADLVTVDLGRFRPDLAGQRIAGRVADGILDPYPDHAAINGGALAGRARILAFMRPSDLLFLQIQGSGRLRLGGRELRVGYDGANGRPYTPVGRTLIDEGALARENVSMQTIMGWLDGAAPDEARRVRETNQSFVFFRVLDALPDPALGPLGSEGVQLTAGRSLAVDPRYTPYGAPVFVSIDADAKAGKDAFRRLLIAQDTGGAIKGPVRGDIYVGGGAEAGEIAGALNEIGEMYVLLPVAVAERLAASPRS